MAHGFNTDVVFDGTLLHVQTEDRAGENPVLETLVYCGGQILHQERSIYDDLTRQAETEPELQRRLERQHRDLVRRARHGEFLAGSRVSFSDLQPETLPLGAAIAAAVEVLEPFAALGIVFKPSGAPGLAGRLGVFRDGEPVAGAAVRARLVGCGLPPARLWSGTTGEDGEVEVAAVLPEGIAGGVIFTAESGEAAGRLRLASREPGGQSTDEEDSRTGIAMAADSAD